MRRVVLSVSVLLVFLSLSAAAASFDFYRAGDLVIGLFNNETGEDVDELLLRFSGPIEPVLAIGAGANLVEVSNVVGELRYTGWVVPNGSWEVDWRWDGAKLEYAAWLKDGEVIEEIDVHSPTPMIGIVGRHSDKPIRFSARGSCDPDGSPLARYSWEWSDGVTAEGIAIARVLPVGVYEVTLTVEDQDGNASSKARRFEVVPPSDQGVINLAEVMAYVTNMYSGTVSVISYFLDQVVATVPVGTYPAGVTVIGNKVYVANSAGTSNPGPDTVSVIDSDTNTVIATIQVGDLPTYIRQVGDRAYVTNQHSESVSVIDIATHTVVDTISVGNHPFPMAVDGTNLFVANYNSGTVSMIDTTTNTVVATIGVGGSPVNMSVVDGKVYVANRGSGTVSVIDIATKSVTSTVSVGSSPVAIATANGKVYVANDGSDNVSVIDPASDSVVATIAVGDAPWPIVASDNRVCVGNRGVVDSVSLIDSATDTVVATIPVGGHPSAMAAFGGKLYVGDRTNSMMYVIDLASATLTASMAVGNTPYQTDIGAEPTSHSD